jgi:hypothetical protein
VAKFFKYNDTVYNFDYIISIDQNIHSEVNREIDHDHYHRMMGSGRHYSHQYKNVKTGNFYFTAIFTNGTVNFIFPSEKSTIIFRDFLLGKLDIDEIETIEM